MVMVELVKNSGVENCTSNLELVLPVEVGEVVMEQLIVACEIVIPNPKTVTVPLFAYRK